MANTENRKKIFFGNIEVTIAYHKSKNKLTETTWAVWSDESDFNNKNNYTYSSITERVGLSKSKTKFVESITPVGNPLFLGYTLD